MVLHAPHFNGYFGRRGTRHQEAEMRRLFPEFSAGWVSRLKPGRGGIGERAAPRDAFQVPFPDS
jgi:hypothetical protein